MKRKAHALIILGCFAIIVTIFINFSLAKTVKVDVKVDVNVDKHKDCARIHHRCCMLRSIWCKKESIRKDCHKPLCTELACKEKNCGDVCKVSYWKNSGKCVKMKSGKNKCTRKRKEINFLIPKCECGEPCELDTDCSDGQRCRRKRDMCGGTCEPIPKVIRPKAAERNIGRPFVVDGRYRATTSMIGKMNEVNANTGWNIQLVPDILANSSSNQDIALAFSNQGEGEHASVASFARHTLQLMTMGAPATLMIGSQKAALDEIKHAKMCYGIAKSFLGAKIQPSTLNIDGSVKTMRKSEIVQSVITEGCIGETLAAVRARLSAHYAKEQNVKGILEEIASDETNHSQLAWNTVQWAINRFPELRVMAEEAFRAQLDRPMEIEHGLPTSNCYDCEKESALHDYGLLVDTDKDTTENLGVQNVIEPVFLNEFVNVDTISTQILNMDFSKYQ